MAILRAMSLPEGIASRIKVIRQHRVILAADLAELYGVPVRRLNEQVRRNADRFPVDFAFQLTAEEWISLKSQFATSKGRGGVRKLPWAFTEHGAIQAANVLNSPRAVQVRSVLPMERGQVGMVTRGQGRTCSLWSRTPLARVGAAPCAVLESVTFKGQAAQGRLATLA